MHKTYLLLGSNLGERLVYLQKAREKINAAIGPITLISTIYETAAWGLTEQQAFLNQVLEVDTALSPEMLLSRINSIEQELGRVREIKWGARLIDIDILYYDGVVIQTQNLTIPHPELQKRRFTLVPLVEIAPDYVHPLFRKTNYRLLTECADSLEVKKFNY